MCRYDEATHQPERHRRVFGVVRLAECRVRAPWKPVLQWVHYLQLRCASTS